MHINLTVSDMAKNNPNKAYYATTVDSENYKLTEEDGTLTFATITRTNKEASDCTAKVTITMDTNEDSMGKVLQKGDAILYITSGKTEETVDLYDLLTEELPDSVTKEIEVELSVSESAEASITGYLKVNNTEIDQSYLAGKTLNITITVDNLVCGVNNGNALKVLSTNPYLESKDHMAARNDTLRRFQGQAEVSGNKILSDVNNYICFGISNKEECKNDTDKYLYRIIGIDTETNELKIIKREALNTAYAWHNADNITWEKSNLQNNLNGSYFLTNINEYPYLQSDDSIESNWTSIIAFHDWGYGDISSFNENTTSTQAFQIEKEAWNNTLENTKIGLMYASDYYLSGTTNNDDDILKCMYGGSDIESCKKSWLYLYNNDTEALSSSKKAAPDSDEWTMTRYSDTDAWYSGGNGVFFQFLTYNNSVRPVFYLTQNIKIIDGDGSLANPYIIKEPSNPIYEAKDVILASKELETEEYMNKREDTLRRFYGQVETTGSKIINDVNNYICFGTQKEDECLNNTDKYMYRIIGIDTTNDQIKLIKREALDTPYAWHSSENITLNWAEADLQSKLNDNYFLTNTLDYPYMQNDNWEKLIEYHDWKYGVLDSGTSGIASDTTSINAFQNEKEALETGSNHGILKNTKIGLMYVSEYYLAGTANEYDYDKQLRCYYNASSSYHQNCKKSWLHLSNNDTIDLSTSNKGAPSSEEWTMSRTLNTKAWAIYSTGSVKDLEIISSYSIRPVFYLKKGLKLSGIGTLNHPYIINNI